MGLTKRSLKRVKELISDVDTSEVYRRMSDHLKAIESPPEVTHGILRLLNMNLEQCIKLPLREGLEWLDDLIKATED